MVPFFPSEKIKGQMARLVNEIGTGPIGMDSGARIQVTAAIRAVMVVSTFLYVVQRQYLSDSFERASFEKGNISTG